MITQIELKRLLLYNPETGLFTKRNTGKVYNKPNKVGYIVITINYKTYLAHRLVWLYVYGKFPDKWIDHINRIKTDNRLINLRDVSPSENAKNGNVHKDNITQVRGVSFHKNRVSPYQARFNSKTIGYFKTIEDAQKALENIVQEI
jgi:hypothetical protein